MDDAGLTSSARAEGLNKVRAPPGPLSRVGFATREEAGAVING